MPDASGTIDLVLAKGQSAVLFKGPEIPALAVAPLAAQSGRKNTYGLRKI